MGLGKCEHTKERKPGDGRGGHGNWPRLVEPVPNTWTLDTKLCAGEREWEHALGVVVTVYYCSTYYKAAAVCVEGDSCYLLLKVFTM